MTLHIVEFFVPEVGMPEQFRCMAEDLEHAWEQCANAYPNARLIWVRKTE